MPEVCERQWGGSGRIKRSLVAGYDDVDCMRVKCLFRLLSKQPSERSTVFAAAGAIHGTMPRGNDESVAVATGLLQVTPQPGRLGRVDVGGIKKRFSVQLEKMHGANAEAVVHAQGVTWRAREEARDAAATCGRRPRATPAHVRNETLR